MALLLQPGDPVPPLTAELQPLVQAARGHWLLVLTGPTAQLMATPRTDLGQDYKRLCLGERAAVGVSLDSDGRNARRLGVPEAGECLALWLDPAGVVAAATAGATVQGAIDQLLEKTKFPG